MGRWEGHRWGGRGGLPCQPRCPTTCHHPCRLHLCLHRATDLPLLRTPGTCRDTKRIACRPGVGGAVIPRTCDSQSLPGRAGDCGMDPYIVLADRASCVDQQTLKMQERPEDVPTGDLPRSMMCLVDRRLCGAVSPGTRVTAVGILSIFQSAGGGGGNQRDKAGTVAIRQPYLRIVGFQEDVLNGDTARRPTFSLEEEQAFKDFAAQPGAAEAIFARIAPQVGGGGVAVGGADLPGGGRRASGLALVGCAGRSRGLDQHMAAGGSRRTLQLAAGWGSCWCSQAHWRRGAAVDPAERRGAPPCA